MKIVPIKTVSIMPRECANIVIAPMVEKCLPTNATTMTKRLMPEVYVENATPKSIAWTRESKFGSMIN